MTSGFVPLSIIQIVNLFCQFPELRCGIISMIKYTIELLAITSFDTSVLWKKS